MIKSKFPRWSAPLVGVIAGGLVGARAGLRADIPWVYCFVGGMLIGGLAGLLVMCLDRESTPPAAATYVPPHLVDRLTIQPSGIVGRVLALIGLLFCWAPFLGFAAALSAIIVNRNSSDWAKKCAWIGLVPAVLSSLIMAVLLIVEAMR